MDGFWPTFTRRRATPSRSVEALLGSPSGPFLSPRLAVVPLQKTGRDPFRSFVKAKDAVAAARRSGNKESLPIPFPSMPQLPAGFASRHLPFSPGGERGLRGH